MHGIFFYLQFFVNWSELEKSVQTNMYFSSPNDSNFMIGFLGTQINVGDRPNALKPIDGNVNI